MATESRIRLVLQRLAAGFYRRPDVLRRVAERILDHEESGRDER